MTSRRTSKVPEVWILSQERCLTSWCRGRPKADQSDVRSGGGGEGFIRGIFLEEKLPCIGPCYLTLSVIMWWPELLETPWDHGEAGRSLPTQNSDILEPVETVSSFAHLHISSSVRRMNCPTEWVCSYREVKGKPLSMCQSERSEGVHSSFNQTINWEGVLWLGKADRDWISGIWRPW